MGKCQMRNKFLFACIFLTIILFTAGCLTSSPVVNIPPTIATQIPTNPQKDLGEAINYSAIRIFSPDPVKTNTSYIAKIALNGEHAKQLLAYGGIIDDTAGRLHSCPKGSSDCYHPAVVIRYGAVPFTIEVDEETGKIFQVFAGVPDYPNPYAATPGLYRIQNTTDNTVSVYNNATLIMIYNATSFVYLKEPGNGTL